jgi:hypothetical protein
MIRQESVTVLLAGLVADAGRTIPDAPRARAKLFKQELEALAPIVESFGGRGRQLAGDSLLATFSSPTDAVRCGMALQDSMWERGRADSSPNRVYLRVAVSHGEARIDDRGTFGEPVEAAGRVLDSTPAGAVCLDDTVASRLAPGAIALDPMPPGLSRARPQAPDGAAPPFGGLHRAEHGGAVLPLSTFGRSIASMVRSAFGTMAASRVSAPPAGTVTASHGPAPVGVLVGVAVAVLIAVAGKGGRGTVPFSLRVLLPTVVPIVVGWVLGQRLGVDLRGARALFRFALLPAVAFVTLSSPGLTAQAAALSLVTGAALVGLAYGVTRTVPALGPRTAPAVTLFALPFLAVSWEGRPGTLAAAVLVAVGATITDRALALGPAAPRTLAREPWLYGAAVGVVWLAVEAPAAPAARIVGPLASAAYPVALAVLGAALSLTRRPTAREWQRVITPLATGVVLVLLLAALVKPARTISEALVVCALAPGLRAGSDEQGADTGWQVVVALAALLVLSLLDL